jgi:beta-lactamase superfamily II metal-dependent hydrolase
MSASKCTIVVLHTDQGMGTLVKIYNEVMGGQQLTSLGLIDLGSETRTKRYAGDALDVIAAALDEMYTPFFDFIVISHQDTDHWSLLPDLSKRLEKYPDIGIGNLYYGGTHWKKKAKDTVTEFATDWGGDVQPWATSLSAYSNPSSAPKPFETIDGVEFCVLMVNADSTKSVANGTSAVISVNFGGSTVILPGDATAQTLSAINTTLKKWKKNPIQPCYLLTAPHHGALATISDNFTTKNPKLTIATEFGTLVSAKWLAASAGFESHFNHPSKKVIAKLSPAVASTAVDHNYIVYDNDNSKWEAINKTDVNIFTTITTLDDPPVRVSWNFEMLPSGQVSFQSEPTPKSKREQRKGTEP